MSSLGQLRNPYSNMSNFLGQWGQERDKQKQIDLQNQRQAVLDGYAKDQNQRQQEANNRQATQAEHQNTLFGEKDAAYNKKLIDDKNNKIYYNAYNADKSDPNYKTNLDIASKNVTPEFAQSLRLNSLRMKIANGKLSNQDLTRKNAELNQNVLQDKLDTISQTKKFNSGYTSSIPAMQTKSKQLSNEFVGDGSQYTDNLSPVDKKLFNDGSKNYNKLNPERQAQFDNLMDKIGTKARTIGNTYTSRQNELDASSPYNILNYMNQDGKYKDNSVFQSNMVKKSIADKIAKSKTISTLNEGIQKLALKTDPNDTRRLNSYVKQMQTYKANINKNADYAHKWLAKEKKDDGSYNRKISDYANQGYDGTQITMFLSGQRPAAPRNTPPVKSLDLTGAEERQVQIKRMQDKIDVLNKKNTYVGSIDLSKIDKDSFGNINVDATPEQINAKKADIQSRLNSVAGISTGPTKQSVAKKIKTTKESYNQLSNKLKSYMQNPTEHVQDIIKIRKKMHLLMGEKVQNTDVSGSLKSYLKNRIFNEDKIIPSKYQLNF